MVGYELKFCATTCVWYGKQLGMELKSRAEEMNMGADLGPNEVKPRGGLDRDGKAREQSWNFCNGELENAWDADHILWSWNISNANPIIFSVIMTSLPPFNSVDDALILIKGPSQNKQSWEYFLCD